MMLTGRRRTGGERKFAARSRLAREFNEQMACNSFGSSSTAIPPVPRFPRRQFRCQRNA